MKKTRVSREDVIEWLLRFRDLDMKKENHRCILNDSFLNTAYVYDDKIALMFNYREGTETISLAPVEGSDLLFFWSNDVNSKKGIPNGMPFLQLRLFIGFAIVLR